MTWRRLALIALLLPTFAHSEPAIKFDCTGATDRRQECTFGFDKDRIEKAFEPVEKQAQGIKSPSEAMDVMAQAMTVFASLIKQRE